MIDRPDRSKYTILKVKHQFQINWYCKLQSMQQHIIGCWKRDFDKILLTNSKNKNLIWIYEWTRWVTRCQPTQCRWVASLPSNHTRVVGSGWLTTRTANLAIVQWSPGPGPKVKVRNSCSPYSQPRLGALLCHSTHLQHLLITSLFHTDLPIWSLSFPGSCSSLLSEYIILPF